VKDYDGKGRGLSNGSDICRNAGGSLFPRCGTATTMEQLENLSDEMTEMGGVVSEWMRIGLNEKVGS